MTVIIDMVSPMGRDAQLTALNMAHNTIARHGVLVYVIVKGAVIDPMWPMVKGRFSIIEADSLRGALVTMLTKINGFLARGKVEDFRKKLTRTLLLSESTHALGSCITLLDSESTFQHLGERHLT